MDFMNDIPSSGTQKNRLTLCCSQYNENGMQRHMHGFFGSSRIAACEGDNHNHRFAGFTGEAITSDINLEGIEPFNEYESHIHRIYIKTDYIDHMHEIHALTGTAIQVGMGKHVHLISGVTNSEKGHTHGFIIDTLVHSPIE